MWTQYELSLSMNKSINQLKKKKKAITEIAKTLGVAKSTVWSILKKRVYTCELSNTKIPGRQRWRRTDKSFPSSRKTTVAQTKNTPQEVRISVQVNNEERTSLSEITVISPLGVNHW